MTIQYKTLKTSGGRFLIVREAVEGDNRELNLIQVAECDNKHQCDGVISLLNIGLKSGGNVV